MSEKRPPNVIVFFEFGLRIRLYSWNCILTCL